ncbi:hypothetical protein G7Y79_00039g076000 [Physcia stellaris]|nr:hypothetical protein G7Y79_00039g076000 [Physcia stellaris]
MYRQDHEAYKQAIAHCGMKQPAQLSFKQQCKILIMIITILLECSKPKQPKLQRDQIKRHELDKARAVFKIFGKADSLKSEDKEVLNLKLRVNIFQNRTSFHDYLELRVNIFQNRTSFHDYHALGLRAAQIKAAFRAAL